MIIYEMVNKVLVSQRLFWTDVFYPEHLAFKVPVQIELVIHLIFSNTSVVQHIS